MSHNVPAPPVILPVVELAGRPRWSVMIPVYNCKQFLPEALKSVLSQALPESEMQIEVIDDASTDGDILALVEFIGKGRVKYFRQKENVGSIRNFETCINRSSGVLVHILHGDDFIEKGYYRHISALFEKYPDAGAAFCRWRTIDENGRKVYDQNPEMEGEGILKNWLMRIVERQLVQYAAITVRREVYEKLGGFYAVSYAEDWEMWVRIARYSPVAYFPEILANYRKHSNSISGNKYLNGQNLLDITTVINLIQHHVPIDQQQAVLRKSRKYYANYGIKIARLLWHQYHDLSIVNAQVKQALNLYQTPILYLRVIKLYVKILFDKV